MSNTLAGVSWENVARKGLSAFVEGLIAFGAFATDLSEDVQEQGTVVKTRIVPAAGAPGDLVNDHSGDYDAAVDDTTLVSVPVTLDQHPIVGFHWTDSEVNQVEGGVFSDTVERMIQQYGWAIANKVTDVLFAAIDTTYTAGVAAVAAANFDADDMWDARIDFQTNAGNMALKPTCVLDSDYYGALGKDAALGDKSASGLDAVISGNIPRVAGFGIVEAPSLAGAAANNTVGFCALPSAMAIAMRAVETSARQAFISYDIVTDPVTGVTMTVATWFDLRYRKLKTTFEALWGRADGVTTSLRRITSA